MPTTIFAARWELTFPASLDQGQQGGQPSHPMVIGYLLHLHHQGGESLPPSALGVPDPIDGLVRVDEDAYLAGLPEGTYDVMVETVGHAGSVASPVGTVTVSAGQKPTLTLPPVPRPAGAPVIVKK
jgi:hypothetical protein